MSVAWEGVKAHTVKLGRDGTLPLLRGATLPSPPFVDIHVGDTDHEVTPVLQQNKEQSSHHQRTSREHREDPERFNNSSKGARRRPHCPCDSKAAKQLLKSDL